MYHDKTILKKIPSVKRGEDFLEANIV